MRCHTTQRTCNAQQVVGVHRDALLMAAGLTGAEERCVALCCKEGTLSRRALLSTYRPGHQRSPHHGLPNTPPAILPACLPAQQRLTLPTLQQNWKPRPGCLTSPSLPESRVDCRLSAPNGARDLHRSPPVGARHSRRPTVDDFNAPHRGLSSQAPRKVVIKDILSRLCH